MARSLLVLVVLLAACDVPTTGAKAQRGPPEKLCDISRTTLDRLVAMGQGNFTYSSDGRATILDSAWNEIPWAQKRDMAKMLAYVAACNERSNPNSVFVTVRSIKSNKVLASGFYATFAES